MDDPLLTTTAGALFGLLLVAWATLRSERTALAVVATIGCFAAVLAALLFNADAFARNISPAWVGSRFIEMQLFLGAPGAAPIIVPAAGIGAFQLLAAVAGRGRPAPFARAGIAVGAIIAVVMAVLQIRYALRYLSGPREWIWAAAVVGFALASAVCVTAVSRGASALVPAAMGMIASKVPFATVLRRETVFYFAVMLASSIVILIALRVLRLGRRELATFGIRPSAPADLAAIPVAAYESLRFAFAPYIVMPPRPQVPGGLVVELALPAILAAVVIFALRYLRTRLDLAERAAASRKQPAEC